MSAEARQIPRRGGGLSEGHTWTLSHSSKARLSHSQVFLMEICRPGRSIVGRWPLNTTSRTRWKNRRRRVREQCECFCLMCRNKTRKIKSGEMKKHNSWQSSGILKSDPSPPRLRLPEVVSVGYADTWQQKKTQNMSLSVEKLLECKTWFSSVSLMQFV